MLKQIKKYRAIFAMLAVGVSSQSGLSQSAASAPGTLLPNVLYGAAYYNEYMPSDLQPGRLEKMSG